jgi:hypothetical protein
LRKGGWIIVAPLIAPVALVSLLAGLVTGGSLRALNRVRVRAWWVAVAAWGLLVAAQQHPAWAGAANVLAYAGLLGVVWVNRHLPGARVMFLGVLLNALVIAANGGRMPVSPAALAAARAPDSVIAALAAGQRPFHFLAGQGARLMWLADVIPIPRCAHVLGGVYSVGDFLLALGFGMAVFFAVRGAGRESVHTQHGRVRAEPA